ncbi:enoyl-CoA hydratase-related protein [Aliikangiella maris]|uniref:Enoyl-CoA hydratase-related protein n=2 Tax=Aliikangiella maris TaxID=3162458 RepID=A0ABV3MRD7_9GAMM
MSNAQILTEQLDSVYQITINRPDKMNALTDAMYGELLAGLREASELSSIKVILICSSGAHFSAGNDLADFLQTEFNLESHVVQFLITLAKLEKPIIAAVNGAAVGIGTTMLLHCDMVFAAADSKFSLPFIKLGLTPEGGSSRLLAQRCGVAKANDWLYSGRNILADEALSSGLVNQVFSDAPAMLAKSIEYAQKIASNSLDSLVATKQVLKGDDRESTVALIKKEAQIFAERLQTPAAKAAFQAFLSRK